MEENTKKDYSKTLNLPKTEFPMRGNLPTKEPAILQSMKDRNLYEKSLEQNKTTGKRFVLHDGPPYANGDIHAGHSLIRTLKDIILRYKAMNGYYTPFVPGWDTHGLPIEKKVQQVKNITKDDVGAVKFREICEEFALEAVENQAKQFDRIGLYGDFLNKEKRYLTLHKNYEAKQIEVFWEMFRKGYIYRDLKPVYWCSDCETALAEAEIEYQDDKTTSIFVKFPVKEDKGLFTPYGALENTYIIIWTTTPWTLPGNQAITVNPEFEYAMVEVQNERYIMAKELVETVMKEGSIEDYAIVTTFKGEALENVTCVSPLLENRTSRVILGSDKDLYVSLDTGSGCVHTAPGHGNEDYLACKRYGDIEVIVPVDKHGKMTEEAGPFAGMYYAKANTAIIEALQNSKKLFAAKHIEHPYPHCWRCKKPIIYRATTQWFVSLDGFRKQALDAVKEVKWYPEWGDERMSNMIKDRADWCISRQRCWGVPIPIFYCEDCGKEHINKESIAKIIKLFAEKGSNAWFELTPEEILGELPTCSCGSNKLVKEMDIMDVWFDSGSSHHAVLNADYELPEGPADMYFEGNDQYRGWFQSSLLTAVATTGHSPYKEVLTNGMVVDGNGKKMSKSLGNGIAPEDIMNQFGADILRLWVISSDYHSEVRLSNEILVQVSEVYKKIRNTLRFLLGNTNDFDANKHYVAYEERTELDQYMMYQLNHLIEYITQAYETYDFHLVYNEIHRFCTAELSSKYLDVMKDILYTYGVDHPWRRSCQSTMYDILQTLVTLVAPVLVFTTEEVYEYMNLKEGKKEGVLLETFPSVDPKYENDEIVEKWDRIFAIKESLAKDIEEARVQKRIGSALDAKITITVPEDMYAFMEQNKENIAFVAITSEVWIEKGDSHNVKVEKSSGDKCPRCWTYSNHMTEEGICKKCLENM